MQLIKRLRRRLLKRPTEPARQPAQMPHHARHLVLTASDKGGRGMLAESIDLMQAYALRIGADFKCIQHENHSESPLIRPHAVKFYSGLELAHYDRVLWIDADCLVSPQCPDIFSHVPSHYRFAAWCGEPELFDPYWELKRPRYRHGYFNSGVVLSADPQPFQVGLDILNHSEQRLTQHEQVMAMGEQTPFNKAVHELGLDVFPLDIAWNFMPSPQTCSDLGITTTLEAAYIVHCAGGSHLQLSDSRCRVSRAAGMRDLRRRLGW